MDIKHFRIEFSRHALDRAMQRKIHPDMVESTIKGGNIKRFGKNRIKFIKKFKNFTVICVGEMAGDNIKIVTIEKG